MLLYTANIGGYDKLRVTEQPGFDFFCWESHINSLTNVKLARYYKICCYTDDVSIWLDSNIKINCNLKDFVSKWLTDDVDMVAMEHGRDCIYDEMDACIERKKDTLESIERQRQFYIKEGFPKHNGMIGSGILIRRDTIKVKIAMIEWWKMVEEYSHRDQLSFNYVQWKSKDKLKINFIPYSVFGNEFELIPHNKK